MLASALVISLAGCSSDDSSQTPNANGSDSSASMGPGTEMGNSSIPQAIVIDYDFADNKEKYGYCWGVSRGVNRLMNIDENQLREFVDLNVLLKGFSDGILEADTMSQAEIEAEFQTFSNLFQNSPDLIGKDEIKAFSQVFGKLDAKLVLMMASTYGISDEINYEAVVTGYRHIVKGEPRYMDEQEANTTLEKYFLQVINVRNEKFLADNLAKDGWKETESGLQIKVIKEGTGPAPGPQDAVKAHYRLFMMDGRMLQTSYEREAIQFDVQGVIPGWTEGLQMMKEGGEYKLVVPQELGYGAQPDPRSGIPPYEVLTFDIELIKVIKK